MDAESDRVDLVTASPVAARRAALGELFPGILTDGVLDVARLGELLDVPLADVATGRERYGLQWAGRTEAVRSLLTPAGGALIPEFRQSVTFDTAGDVFVAGDNLEVLKLLQKAYHARIRLIYIDPPYNTGHQFVYRDDFTDGLRNYLAFTGQLDADGKRRSAAAEVTGRRHSRWLSMMYPRLALARNLLTPDGVLVVSIDTHEIHALRMLLDEVFGAENHVADIIWQKKYTRSNDARFFSDNHEYLVVYARAIDTLTVHGEPRSSRQDSAYRNPDGDPNGPWKATPLHAKSGRPGAFRHTFDNGRVWSPPVGTFPRFTHERLEALERAGAIWFGVGGRAQPSRKTYRKDLKARLTPTTLWLHTEVGSTHEAGDELKHLGLAGAFDNPKPTRLIRRLVQLFTDADDLVLDFFAGSGTTAHAVLLENAADGGRRRSISVNLPEPVADRSPAAGLGHTTVADITRNRILAALDRTQAGNGLRVLTLGPSNFVPTDADDTRWALTEASLHGTRRDWPAIGLEVLLAEGVPLHAVWERHDLGGAPAVLAAGVCVVLTDRISTAVADAALCLRPRVLVFCEDGFAGADTVRANTLTNARNRGIIMKTV